MYYFEFQELCFKQSVDPKIAIENEKIQSALRNMHSKGIYIGKDKDGGASVITDLLKKEF